MTRKSGGYLGAPFAPSASLLREFHPGWGGPPLTEPRWQAFRLRYLEEMRRSYAQQFEAWAALFVLSEVTLCCYERPGEHCHRVILGSEILPKLGAVYEGEC